MMMEEAEKTGKVTAISISKRKGEKKSNVQSATLKYDFGIEGDAHSGNWHRQISLLAVESVNKMRDKGLDVNPGDFAENITTEGLDLLKFSIGTKLKLGSDTIIEITQIGKECHSRCNIYYQAGDCVMPKEGVFAKVLKGGVVKSSDSIKVLNLKEAKSV